jgi:hypothetical protein
VTDIEHGIPARVSSSLYLVDTGCIGVLSIQDKPRVSEKAQFMPCMSLCTCGLQSSISTDLGKQSTADTPPAIRCVASGLVLHRDCSVTGPYTMKYVSRIHSNLLRDSGLTVIIAKMSKDDQHEWLVVSVAQAN